MSGHSHNPAKCLLQPNCYLAVAALAGEGGDTVEVLAPEGVFWRQLDGSDGVQAMNSAWRGLQAGAAFTAAMPLPS